MIEIMGKVEKEAFHTQDYTESAASLYGELLESYRQAPEYASVYRGYSAVFYKVLTFNTQFLTVNFNGPYAKAAYLLKEHGADDRLVRIVNDARVRIRGFNNAADKQALAETLGGNFRHDLEALCLFISLVYGIPVPEELRQHFPPRREGAGAGRLVAGAESLRFIVDSWDESCMYGFADGHSDSMKVSYSHCLYGNAGCCWDYLREYLAVGRQFNLVRPRIKDGTVFPELIIFEPDYLVNITEIAECFQPYSVDAANHLVRRFQQQATSQAILLGNLAGQLLDEEVSGSSAEKAYRDSAMDFFRGNALNMLATETSPSFHKDAQSQKANIRNAFAELPKAVGGYDKDKLVLEPSFFSQMLGLQGRVDLLQQDFKFLVEQKSGKCAFPYPRHPGETPLPLERHYVQILLYMMVMRYNYREQYERNKKSSFFLLYSKYPSSLCGVEFAPELMFKAVKIRNGIVRAGYGYAKGGFAVLDTLTPESFLKENVSPRLWNDYIRPQLAQVLDPIHQASELERRYFHRMLAFIANEHLLAKVGTNQREDSGLASIWLSDLEEKLQAGNIYTDLRLLSPSPGHKGAVRDIVLGFGASDDNSMSNFRKGDIVILYPYAKGSCPDACKAMILRCTVVEISQDSITLRLRAQQSTARIFTEAEGSLWAVEHDFMEASFSSQYRGMHSFLTTTKERRDLLLMQRRPEHDETVALNGSYGQFDELALRVKQAKDIFLIIGPPGTGKTSYGMLDTLKEELSTPASTVLVVSFTNRAVDEICGKLVESGIDFIRLGSPLSAEKEYHKYLIETKVDEFLNINDLRQLVRSTRVIVGTTTALSSSPSVFALKKFDLLIVDEASQILEPHLLPLLTAMHNGEPAIKKTVMIGDHKQLPAVVRQTPAESAVSDPLLNSINLKDCRLSLFERLLGRYGNDSHITYMLTRQGRMHRDIAMFPSEAFYEGRLEVVPLPHQDKELAAHTAGAGSIDDILASRRIAFIAVDAPEDKDLPTDKVNPTEAEVIAAAVHSIYKKHEAKFDASTTVGVIVPYRNQIATVRNAIGRYRQPQLNDITIDTVERFQGSQRDYIIYGFTVRKYYQLQFLTNNTFVEKDALIDRKLNVAMTRAREHLLMTGNPRLLSQVPVFKRLIDFIKSRDGYFDFSQKP